MDSVFNLLDNDIKNFLTEKNIKKPTEPQKKSIPSILGGKNVLLIAPTGLGKTESALLPIFHNFLKYKSENKDRKKGFSILYITPLRALNRDMLKRTFEWGKRLNITIGVRHGDTTQNERAKQSRNPPDMLITTPETLQIMFTGKRLRNHLKSVKWVIVDEVHELACDERGAQLSIGLERLEELTKQNNYKFQRIGLSATVGLPDEVAKYLGGFENNDFRNVEIIEVDATKNININVEYPETQKEDYKLSKYLLIEPISFTLLRRCKEVIDKHKSTLFFTNTRDAAEILSSRFYQWQKDMKIGVHHGSLSKNARIESENDFKNGKIKSLICTSSLELGIDVGNTDFVIQYNSPRQVTRLVQRVGRSGHKVGKTSKGLIFSTNAEDFSESLVIARRSLHGELENFIIRKNPLSVLTNQIISIVLEYGKIQDAKVYEIIKKSYPFYKLNFKLFEKILSQLKNQRSIWFEYENAKTYLIKRKNSRNYFLDNISMIPDEKSYNVVDIGSRKIIGKLDESFVLSSIFEGEKIILNGRPWTIVKTEDDEILVSPANQLGDIPSWIGEDIPVPFEVGMEVGMFRRLAAENTSIKQYPTDKKSIEKFYRYISKQKEQGFFIPSDKLITIESEEKNVVINACFGTKVNETLGRLISSILAQSLGESVGINSDAYRINLEIPGRFPVEKIRDILLKTDPETLEYIIETILRNSTYVRWQLINVARKFGALRKDFDFKNIGSKRLFGIFENSLVFDEALDKLIWELMDVKNTKLILKKLQNKEIDIKIQGLSPISIAGFETVRGLMVPQKADRSILMALKRRIEDTDITLICTNCRNVWNTAVRRVDDQPKCSKCGAIKISVIKRYNKDLAKLFAKKKIINKQENKELKRLHKNASLVLSYGKHAILALMARGIGPDTAARILRKYNKQELFKSEETEIKFLRDILKAELNYAKTRGFWDD